jgi:hypothetical protein
MVLQTSKGWVPNQHLVVGYQQAQSQDRWPPDDKTVLRGHWVLPLQHSRFAAGNEVLERMRQQAAIIPACLTEPHT